MEQDGDVVGIERPDLLGERGSTFDPSSFDCDIQLPADIEVGSSTSLDRMTVLLTQGLLRRISGASGAPVAAIGCQPVRCSASHLPGMGSPRTAVARGHPPGSGADSAPGGSLGVRPLVDRPPIRSSGPRGKRSSQTGWAWPPVAVSAKALSQAVSAAGGPVNHATELQQVAVCPSTLGASRPIWGGFDDYDRQSGGRRCQRGASQIGRADWSTRTAGGCCTVSWPDVVSQVVVRRW